jgi:hypothetical protein
MNNPSDLSRLPQPVQFALAEFELRIWRALEKDENLDLDVTLEFQVTRKGVPNVPHVENYQLDIKLRKT